MAHAKNGVGSKLADDRALRDQAIIRYAELGDFGQTARDLGITPQLVRQWVRSPEGSNTVERIQRDNARSRAVRLGGIFDRLLNRVDLILSEGHDVVTKDGLVKAAPQLKDIVNAIAWVSNSLDKWSELVSGSDVIDVTQLSPEEERKNVDRMRALIAEAEKRLASRTPPPQALTPENGNAQEDWFA